MRKSFSFFVVRIRPFFRWGAWYVTVIARPRVTDTASVITRISRLMVGQYLCHYGGFPTGSMKKEFRKHLCIFDGAKTGILLENEDNLQAVDSLWHQIIKVNYIDFENARDILLDEDIIESLAPPEWISLLKDIFVVFKAQWCLQNSLLHRTVHSRIHQHR